MNRTKFLKKYFGRFALALLLLGTVVYTVYHTFSLYSDSLLTIPARDITDQRIISGEAYLFREETLLTVPQEGVTDDLAVSGSKVGSGVTLCEVWTDGGGDSTARQTVLDTLNRAIRILEESQLPAGTPLSRISVYRTEAESALLVIRQLIQAENYGSVTKLEDEMLTALNRCAALTGDAETLASALEKLREEKTGLLTGTPLTVTNQGSSGYFYNRSCVDGFETVFTKAELDGLTYARWEELKNLSPETEANGITVGKMAYGYDWHLAVGFSDGIGDLFEAGKQYEVAFPENGGRVLPLTCERILYGDGGETLVILRSDVTPAEFSYLRGQRVEITLESRTGYYVPENALTEVDGMTGVYVLEGSTVYFRQTELLWHGKGYAIASENADGKSGYLALNDLMVTSGKNLYDGKVYK